MDNSFQNQQFYRGGIIPAQYNQQQFDQGIQPVQFSNQRYNINNFPPMIWVQGESGAKGYMMPNNTTLPLWDSEANVVYIKSVDMYGKPSLTILDYEERVVEQEEKPKKSQYATKEQVDALIEQFDSFNEKLNNANLYVTKDQLETINNLVSSLGEQVNDIENRITSFSKPQHNSNNRKGNDR